MAQIFEFWTHGIATILESPGLAQLLARATNLGTVVEQDANTQAWFHIPITTPTVMENDTMIYLRGFGLRAKVNENANVDRIHMRRGTDLAADRIVNHTNTTIREDYDIGEWSSSLRAAQMSNHPQLGLAMSIHVRFLTGTPRGRVEFQGAGARFS